MLTFELPTCIGVARGAPPGREIFWVKFTRESYKCTPAEQEWNFLRKLGEIWTVGVVNLVVLDCVSRVTTKKGRQLFGGRKVHPQRKSWLCLCPRAADP